MNGYARAVAGVIVALNSCTVFSYAVPTHEKLSAIAAGESTLSDPAQLRNIGLRALEIDNLNQVFPNSNGTFMTIRNLVEFGARWEDDSSDSQALRHFYNPIDGQALSLPVIGTYLSTPSPDWALEDTGNEFSYSRARGYYFRALTSTDASERQRAWGKTFQTLGQVIHHLQDMAQPQHVRNEAHCNALKCLGLATFVYWQSAGHWLDELYHPSRYEIWASENPPADHVFHGYPTVFSSENPTTFVVPRDFWETSASSVYGGKGIAQYTNRGFYSARTLEGSMFPEPQHEGTNEEKLEDLCNEAAAAGWRACNNVRETDYVLFYRNSVYDTLRIGNKVNPRAATWSVYDEDLIVRTGKPVMALNRFNFEAAYEFLLPRAVGYSAGLINYFFRGQLTVLPPEPQGLYSIIDQLPSSPSALHGFDKVKVRLRNATPVIEKNGGAVPQDMSGGTILAVARFFRDECWLPDPSSGAFLLPSPSDSICRSAGEELVKSVELSVPGDLAIPSGDEPPVDVTFQFDSANLIPVNAIDLTVQIIYRGQLGEEFDAVVVHTIDISEPTPVVHSNDQDYQWDENHNVFQTPFPEEFELRGMVFVFSNHAQVSTPLTGYSSTVGRVQVGKRAGVWVLADAARPPFLGGAECETCPLRLDLLRPRRVKTPADGSGASIALPVPAPMRGLWVINGMSYTRGGPEPGDDCIPLGLSACINKYFPPYSSVVPSYHVSIQH